MQSAKTAIVIGGGIAGCTSARSLARRGWQVTLIERHNSLASEGSGNPAGIIYSKLAATLHTPHNRFALMSFLFALRFYKHLLRNCRQHANTIDASLCGVLQLAHNDKELASWRQLGNSYRQYSELVQFLDAAQASRVSGIEVSQPALFFPDAGWLCFPELCQYLAHHSQINILLERQVKQLLYADEQWQLLDDKGSLIAQAPVVILANAADARELVPDVNLPVKSIRGQITSVPATNESAALKTVICHSGYVTPATTKGIHCLGATYTLHDNDERVRNTDHQENWQQLRRHLPSLSQLIEPPDINDNTGRVAFRCVSPDYLPLLGPMPDSQQFLSDYSALRKNARADIPIPGHYQRGLYTNIGHGSRGLANAPVCAELLASLICGEIRPLEQPLVQALNPGRFIIRNLRRNKI